MKLLLEDVLKTHIKVEPTSELFDKIKKFRMSWVRKGDIYIDFLSNGLVGVHPIRFSTQDENILFADIFQCDRDDLMEDVHKCKDVNKDFKIVSNPTHIAIYFLMHKYVTSKLPDKLKHDAIKELYLILAYKYLSSIVQHYFKYNVELDIAKAVYERMSMRFQLKKLKTWNNVLDARAGDVLPGGIHYDRLKIINQVQIINNVLSDLQGRLREIIKNIYTILIEVNEQNTKITSTSSLTMTDDGEGIKDSINSQQAYIDYLRNICRVRQDFFNMEIIDFVHSMNNRLSRSNIIACLEYMVSDNYKNMETIIEDIILLCITVASKKGYINDFVRDVIEITSVIRGYVAAGNTNDRNLSKIKEELKTVVKKSIKGVNNNDIPKYYTCIILYIFYRAIFNHL